MQRAGVQLRKPSSSCLPRAVRIRSQISPRSCWTLRTPITPPLQWSTTEARHYAGDIPFGSVYAAIRRYGTATAAAFRNDASDDVVSSEQSIQAQLPSSEGRHQCTLNTTIQVLSDPAQIELLTNCTWCDVHHLDPINLLCMRTFSGRLRKFARSKEKVLRCPINKVSTTLLPLAARALELELKVFDAIIADDANLSGYYYLFNAKEIGRFADASASTTLKSLYDCQVAKTFAELYHEIVELVRKRPEVIWSNYLDVILAICGHNVEALPQIHVSKKDSRGDTSQQTLVKLVNEKFDIYVGKLLHPEIPAVLRLSELILKYCKQVCNKMDPTQNGYLSFEIHNPWGPAEWIGKATSAMGLGNIQHDERELTSIPSFGQAKHDSESIQIFETQLKAKDTLLGQPVMGFTRRASRRHAIMAACVELKDRLQRPNVRASIDVNDYCGLAKYWNAAHDDDPGPVPPSPDERLENGSNTEGFQPEHMINSISVDNNVLLTMVSALRRISVESWSSSTEWTRAYDEPEPVPLVRNLTKPSSCSQSKRASVPARTSRSVPKTLPIRQSEHLQSILKAVDDHDITIIRAATGSGKTTQVPQMLFDSAGPRSANIVITQPRRVSTVTVAQRVASERSQRLGLEIGYQVRWDDRSPRNQGINFMTSGYLNRLLEIEPRKLCLQHSHIILDEVHDRDIDTDLLLTTIKNLWMQPPPGFPRLPKIVLMSATINAEFFERYFASASTSGPSIASIDVPGRQFDVATTMLDDIVPMIMTAYPNVQFNDDLRLYVNQQLGVPVTSKSSNKAEALASGRSEQVNRQEAEDDDESDTIEKLSNGQVELDTKHVPLDLIALTLDHLARTTQQGDILIFLPGLSEIDALHEMLLSGQAPSISFANETKYKIFRLHSVLAESNYHAWQPVVPGCRRIVLATNIAETSITLPDVQQVIDTGYSRQNYFDQATQAGNFGMRWISKAEVAQRQGRAGRTQPGKYLAMYSKAQYEAMFDEPSPEILRAPLDSLVLRTETSQALRLGRILDDQANVVPGSFLATAPTPPVPANVSAAVDQLKRLHALTTAGLPTTLGSVLSHFPLRPFASKSALLGILFRCFSPLLTISSLQTDLALVQNPAFTSAANRSRKDFAGLTFDDHVADWRAASLMSNALKNDDIIEQDRLAHDAYVRLDALSGMVRVARQCYETFLPLFSSSNRKFDYVHKGEDWLVNVPSSLDANSDNVDLIKSILLSSSSSRLAVWHDRQWMDQKGRKILCTPRSVNHASSRGDKMLHRLCFEDGDILSYEQLRIVPGDKYPWACETSAVSPLMAMLFAESLRLVGDSTLVINDWLYYQVKVEGKEQDASTSSRAAKIILEFRKALDRFIMHALAKVSLYPHQLQIVIDRKMQAEEFNTFFKEEVHPFRKIMVENVIKILDDDAKMRKARVLTRLQVQLDSLDDDDTKKKSLLELENLMKRDTAQNLS